MESESGQKQLRVPGEINSKETFGILCLALVGVFLGSVLLYWSLRFPSPPLNADSFVYISGAKSLAEGNGYRMEWHEGRPPIGLYPPGNSWWLSLFWPKGAGLDVVLPRLSFSMAIIGAMTNAVILAFLFRGGIPLWLAVSITMVWSVSPLWVQWLHFFMSDPAFLLFVMAGMALFVGHIQRPTLIRWTGLGILLALSLAWRSAAMGLIIGVGVVLMVSRASLLTWIAALGPAVAALATRSSWAGTGGAGYLENYTLFVRDYGGLRGLFLGKVDELLSWFSGRYFFEGVFPLISRTSAFLEREHPSLAWIASLLMGICFVALLVLAWVGWKAVGVGRRGIAAVLVVYSLSVFAAPNQGWYVHRYLYPVWILLLLAFAHGFLIRFPSVNVPGTWQRRSIVLVLLVLAAVNAWGSVRVCRTWNQPSWVEDLRRVAERLKSEPVNGPRVALDINWIPAVYLGDRLGSGLVDAYMVPRRGRFLPIFVRHSDQGYARADFLLTTTADEAALTLGFLQEIPITSSNSLRLFRVTPVEEAAWRRRAHVPEEEPTRPR